MHHGIKTVTDLESFLQQDQNHNWAFKGLDLLPFEKELQNRNIQNSFFLGCQMSSTYLKSLENNGNLVFPSIPTLPYHPFRNHLYTAKELLQGYEYGNFASFLTQSQDGQIYRHYKKMSRNHVISTLMERIHDHAIDAALEKLLSINNRKMRSVGIMGGHSCKRNDPAYTQIAELGYYLAQSGYFVVTGGGPGAMEAGNLGAYMSQYPLTELHQALEMLQVAQTYTDDLWFDSALDVLKKWPKGAESLGVPTWFYGHEPSNLFASYIAKYFANSIREDGILTICYGGIVYAPGSAGTIQEIFQDACQNHYGSCEHISAMVFLGTDYWTKEKPVYPLLFQLAQSRVYQELLGIYDDVPSIIEHLQNHPCIAMADIEHP